jgi:hypothetical protein
MTLHSRVRSLATVAVIGFAIVSATASAEEAGPASLKSRFEALRKSETPFGIPLYIESKQTAAALAGDIHSRIGKPFETVRGELSNPKAWCEILMLHPNVNGCAVDTGDTSLTLRLGSAETPAKFDYRIVESKADYLDVRLGAKEGPVGTSDYRFRVEATPLDAHGTLLHLAYSHGYGARAKLALQAYFSTFGRGKVGFTVVDRGPDGKPVYVSDLRGGLERNAMRYYLAIQSHLDALGAPAAERLERGMRAWLAQTERYPLQLKEEDGFVARKRGELKRFRAGATALQARGG